MGAWIARSAVVLIVFFLGWLVKPHIQLEFSNAGSLIFILLCFLGLLGWLTYMALTQRRIMRNFVTRQELHQAFMNFRKELKGP